MTALSMAQRLSSIPIGAPQFVTKSSTPLQSMTLTAENRWMCVSLVFQTGGREREEEGREGEGEGRGTKQSQTCT